MDLAKFFAAVRRDLFGGTLNPAQVAGMEALLKAFQKAQWPLAHAAYGLATALHETARTMQPIAEYGKGRGQKYGAPGKHGQVAYGRGFVQLTWDFNYQKADDELGLGGALIRNYDLAMRPDIAADIMIRGMAAGWFTGKANMHYLNKTPPDYLGARRIINGTDKASLIASYARGFEGALRVAGYGTETKPAEHHADSAYSPPGPSLEPRVIPEPTRNDGTFQPPASEAPWWSRVVNKLLGKEP